MIWVREFASNARGRVFGTHFRRTVRTPLGDRLRAKFVKAEK
jgi:hypothetical protein